MSVTGIAVIGLVATNLAQTIAWSRLHMRVADRLRLVSPPKQQQQDGTAEQPATKPLREVS